LLETAAENGITVLFSTHAPAQALRLATRVIMLDHGLIVEDGEPERVLSAPENPTAAAFLGHWRF